MEIWSLIQIVICSGLIWGIMSLGVFISYRILDVADLSVESVFPLGGAVAVLLILNNVHPILVTLIVFIVGMIAGSLTGLLHTKFKIPVLLSGIIMMTGLYSIILRVLGAAVDRVSSSNVAIPIKNQTIFSDLIGIVGRENSRIAIILISLLFVILITVLLYWFFGTEVGISLRATGLNAKMSKASGINTSFMLILGLALSNGLIALSGALFAQFQAVSDVNSGKGAIVIGLATIILGEAVFGKRNFKNQLISVILGSLLYYTIIQIAIGQNGFETGDLKLLYALIILIVLIFPILKATVSSKIKKAQQRKAAINPEYAAHLSDKELLKEKARIKRLEKVEEKSRMKEIKESKKLAIKMKNKNFEQKQLESEEKYRKSLLEEQNKKSVGLEILNLQKHFMVDGNDKTIISDLNLTLEPGEFVTIIGGNGSGKTTLLNCISGVYEVDKGSIKVDRKEITGLSENKRARYISRVFQDPNSGTCSNMSIIHNMIIAYNRGKTPSLRWGLKNNKKKIFINKLKPLNLELEKRLEAKAGDLSGGQRQALTLIMANLKRPDLLLLDEHCAALDPKTAHTVMEVTENIVKENKITTLMVTHNMKDAIKYGDRLIMLNRGRIVFDTKGEEKKKLTVEDLLKRFKETEFEYDDALILG